MQYTGLIRGRRRPLLTSTVTYGLANELCKPCEGISKTKRSPWTSRSRSCYDWWCDSSDASEVANGLDDVRAYDIVTDGLPNDLYMYRHFIHYLTQCSERLCQTDDFVSKKKGFWLYAIPLNWFTKRNLFWSNWQIFSCTVFNPSKLNCRLKFLVWDLCIMRCSTIFNTLLSPKNLVVCKTGQESAWAKQ